LKTEVAPSVVNTLLCYYRATLPEETSLTWRLAKG